MKPTKKAQRRKKAEGIKRPKTLEEAVPLGHPAFERERMLHDLQVQQIELESQNRELRETHRFLEVSRDRYADLYDFAPVGYVTLDDQGLIQEINLTAAGMLNVERSRLIGLPFSLHVVKDDLPALREHLRKLARPEDRAATELGLTVKGGGTIQVELQTVPVLEAGRKTRLTRSTLTDITLRKAAETLLRNNEARLRAILDTAVEGIITIDERGVIESFNPAAERIFGYHSEETIGQNVSLLMPAPYREQHEDYLAHYRQTGERKVIGIGREVLGQRKNGEVFPLDLSVSEVRLAGGRLFTGFLRDISERKQAEEALRRSEANLASGQKVAHVGSYEVDVPGAERLHWSAETFRILGLDPAQQELSLKEYLARVVHPDDQARVGEEIQRTENEAARYDIEYRIVRPDHSIRHVHSVAEPVRGPDKKVIKVIGALQDITERKRAEAAVRRSEAMLTRAQEIAHLGSYEIDVSPTGASHWSAETFRILGLDPAGKDLTTDEYLHRIVHPEDRERIREALEHALSEGGRYEADYRIVRPDGSIRQVHSVAEPMLGPDQQVYKLVGFLQDITERKELEREILEISEREQNRIGQDLHDGLCQHLAGIEFRLLGLKQKLEGKLNKQAAETTDLAKLVRQGIEQTHTLARGLSPVMLEAGGLMKALQELAQTTEKVFNTSCSLNCPAPVFIHDNAVATHLYRIAQEAIRNAIRHGKAKFIVINLLTRNDRIVLGVKDDGVGFPSKPHPHKGMGLRIMQYRAGMVGGSLVVQHEPEGGTSIVCSLRADRGGPETEPAQGKPGDASP